MGNPAPTDGMRWHAVAAGIVAGFLLSLAVAGAVAAVVYSTGVTEQAARGILYAAGVASLALASGYGARLAGTRGWVHGVLIGLGYATIALALSPVIAPGAITVGDVTQRLAVGAAVGAIGGVIGVNL